MLVDIRQLKVGVEVNKINENIDEKEAKMNSGKFNKSSSCKRGKTANIVCSLSESCHSLFYYRLSQHGGHQVQTHILWSLNFVAGLTP